MTSGELEFGEVWHCRLCDRGKGLTRAQFLAHCHERHPEVFNREGRIAALRTELLHLEGEDFTCDLDGYQLPDGLELARATVTRPRETTFSHSVP